MTHCRNEDWTAAAARWGAFWKGECLDRPPAVVFAWDAEAAKPPAARSLEERYTSPEYLARRTRHVLRHTHHLGDAPAIARLDLGPVCGARLFGGIPEYAANTIWHHPVASGVEALRERLAAEAPGEEERRFAELEAQFRFPLEAGIEDALPAIPDLGGPVDILASLVGSESLCLDMLAEPGLVAETLDVVAARFNRFAVRMLERFAPAPSDWLNLYAPEGYFTIGEDITAMISPGLVRDLVAPAVRRALRGLPNPVFHFHSGALPTLEALLEIPDIRLLQWTSDPNHMTNPPVRYFEAIGKILDAGKLFFLYIDPDHIEAFAGAFPRERVAFGFNAASPAHGREIVARLANAYRLSPGRGNLMTGIAT